MPLSSKQSSEVAFERSTLQNFSQKLPVYNKFKFAKKSERSISWDKKPKLLNFNEYQQQTESIIKHEEKFHKYRIMPKETDVKELRRVSNSRERKAYVKEYPKEVEEMVEKMSLNQAQKDKLSNILQKKAMDQKKVIEKKLLLKKYEDTLEFYSQNGEDTMQNTISGLNVRIEKLNKYLAFFSMSNEQLC